MPRRGAVLLAALLVLLIVFPMFASGYLLAVGRPEMGQKLMEDVRIAGVAFTGSTAVGRKIVQASAGNLKRVQLELGGPVLQGLQAQVAHRTDRTVVDGTDKVNNMQCHCSSWDDHGPSIASFCGKHCPAGIAQLPR